MQQGWRGVVVVVGGSSRGPGGSFLGCLLSGIGFIQRYQFLCGVWVEGGRVGFIQPHIIRHHPQKTTLVGRARGDVRKDTFRQNQINDFIVGLG